VVKLKHDFPTLEITSKSMQEHIDLSSIAVHIQYYYRQWKCNRKKGEIRDPCLFTSIIKKFLLDFQNLKEAK